MSAPVVTLDDHLRLAIEGDGQRLAAQLDQDNAQQLAIALIEFSRKEVVPQNAHALNKRERLIG